MEPEDSRVEEPDIVVNERRGFLAPLLIWFSPVKKQLAKATGAILLVLTGVVQLFIGK